MLPLPLAMPKLPDFSSLPSPLTRALAIIGALRSVRLLQVLFDFSSVVGSQFWDGRRTGPDFISPMASLIKRQSGHLAKLGHEHSKTLPNLEPGSADTSRRDDFPQAVAILDLHDVPDHHLESQYTTPADIDLMVLVPILLSLIVGLRTGQWSPTYQFIVIDFIGALILGPGTLKLIRRTSTHPTESDPGSGCAVLLDDDLMVVIQGSQEVVEAITEGGFYLSLGNPRLQSLVKGQQTKISLSQKREEEQAVANVLYGTLEGGCRGGCEAIAMRFLHLNFTIPSLKQICFAVVFGRMVFTICRWGFAAFISDHIPQVAGVTPLRLVARVTGEFLGLLVVAACFMSESSATLLLDGVSFFTQSFYFAWFARLVMQSQNYRIRTQRFLSALPLPVDRPPIRKWPFRTRASAATFACLVLCRDSPRPVKDIDVSGVLDTLIPSERGVWGVWKRRVSDRIIHETHINFAPTIPAFPDSERQERLKLLLDEAQSGYETYAHLPSRRRESAPVSGKAPL